MNKLIMIAAFVLGANAMALQMSIPENSNFSPAYSLHAFQINEHSSLPASNQIEKGTIEINKLTHQLRLTLYLANNCAPGMLCTMTLRAPVIIVLPITYEGSGIAGGKIFVAQRDDRMNEGALFRLEIIDNNGVPTLTADDLEFKTKPVTVTVTEQPARTNVLYKSEMSGFPVP